MGEKLFAVGDAVWTTDAEAAAEVLACIGFIP